MWVKTGGSSSAIFYFRRPGSRNFFSLWKVQSFGDLEMILWLYLKYSNFEYLRTSIRIQCNILVKEVIYLTGKKNW